MKTETLRESWADKAKFIGIMLMLLGHNALANEAIFDFIYSFHMPLFFIISGYFASNKTEAFKNYLIKNIKGLLLPYLVFYILTLPYGLFVIWAHPYNHPYDGLGEFIIKPIIGLFTVKTTSFAFHTNGPSWFFVALFFVKLIFYIPKRFQCSLISLFFTTMACISLLIVLNFWGINLYGRMNVALMAYPLYVGGYIVHHYTSYIYFVQRLKILQKIVFVIALFGLCYLGSRINGHVEFSAASYGSNMLLMYLIAILGTLGTIVIAHILPHNKYILTIGGGTAVILGLHSPIQQAVKEISALFFNIPTRQYSLVIAVVMIIIIAFIHIPIIRLFNDKMPLLIGKSIKSKKNENYSYCTWKS